MAEYIDRERLKQSIHSSDLTNREKTALLLCVSSVPAADVEPVRHGRWEIYLGGNEIMCSSCKSTFFTENGNGSRYCPHCGAKMDGEVR